MAKSIIIVRIDPSNRSITRLKMVCKRNAMPEVRRILRAHPGEEIGWHRLLDIEPPDDVLAAPVPLIAAGLIDASEDMLGWRLRGCAGHAGIGILFGQGPGGGMIDVPVDTNWVARRIVWSADEASGGGHG